MSYQSWAGPYRHAATGGAVPTSPPSSPLSPPAPFSGCRMRTWGREGMRRGLGGGKGKAGVGEGWGWGGALHHRSNPTGWGGVCEGLQKGWRGDREGWGDGWEREMSWAGTRDGLGRQLGRGCGLAGKGGACDGQRRGEDCLSIGGWSRGWSGFEDGLSRTLEERLSRM